MEDSKKRSDRPGSLKNPRIRERLRGFKRFKKGKKELGELENKLKRLWQRLMKKGATKQNLCRVVLGIEWLPLQIKALKEFLKREDLIFDDFDEMLDRVEEIFKEAADESLENEFWQVCFALATPDDLFDIIRFKDAYSNAKAWGELDDRIQGGLIRKGKARQILTQLIEECPEKESRMRFWKELKKLEPPREELFHILGLPFVYSMPSLEQEVQKLLRRKHGRKDRNAKIINKIQEVIEEITKKGQE